MLPEFFEKTFNLSHHIARLVAATYLFKNLVARPGGGLLSDKIGSRKWALTAMIGGVGIGYFLMSRVIATWALPGAIALTMFCAFSVLGGAGATLEIQPSSD